MRTAVFHKKQLTKARTKSIANQLLSSLLLLLLSASYYPSVARTTTSTTSSMLMRQTIIRGGSPHRPLEELVVRPYYPAPTCFAFTGGSLLYNKLYCHFSSFISSKNHHKNLYGTTRTMMTIPPSLFPSSVTVTPPGRYTFRHQLDIVLPQNSCVCGPHLGVHWVSTEALVLSSSSTGTVTTMPGRRRRSVGFGRRLQMRLQLARQVAIQMEEVDEEEDNVDNDNNSVYREQESGSNINIGGDHQNKPRATNSRTKTGRLYRADRVLANRTGKPRSECFTLLQQFRVFQKVLEEVNPTVHPDGRDNEHKRSKRRHRDASRSRNQMNRMNQDTELMSSSAVVSLDTTITVDTSSTNSDDKRHQYKWVVIPGPSLKIPMDAELQIDYHHQHRINSKDEEYDALVPDLPPLLMVYHKPKWVLSVRNDPHQRPCLDPMELLPDLHPVGRLDYDTSGLLLFSSSGALTQALLHPKHQIEKEYEAIVSGQVNMTQLQHQLYLGVQTADGIYTAQLVSVHHWEAEQVPPYLQMLQQDLPPEYNVTQLRERGYFRSILECTHLSTLRLSVCEGKYRMVRRILANCGYPVLSLHRHRFGAITLGNVESNETRILLSHELEWAAGLIPKESNNKTKPIKNNKPSGSSTAKKMSSTNLSGGSFVTSKTRTAKSSVKQLGR